jgi:glycosyltransferase involved in cell wall biosynthesis
MLDNLSPDNAAARPVRVMIVAAVPGTVEAFLVEQIQGLRGLGYEVTVVCSPGAEFQRLEESGIKCIGIPIPRAIRPLRLLAALFKLFSLFRSHRPDVIHTHTPVAAFLGQLAGRLAGVRVRITTVHGLIFSIESRKWVRRAYRALEVMSCRWATHVISVNHEDAQDLAAIKGIGPEKVSVFHVGVNLDSYDPGRITPEQRRAVREEWEVPPDSVVLGIVARLTHVKGILELLEAFSKVSARHSDCHLILIGPVDNVRGNGVTEADARRLGCTSRCRFTGPRRDVPRLMAAMDVFCLPSRFEGYPAALMEAAAMQLPAITTDIRGSREAVQDGVTGLVVPPRDPEALAAAMEKLLLDPRLRHELGVRARERALKEFDRRGAVAKTLQVYRTELARLGH